MAHENNLIFINIEYEKKTSRSSQAHNHIRQPFKLLHLIINSIEKSQPSNQYKEICKISEKVPQGIQLIPKYITIIDNFLLIILFIKFQI